MIIFFKRENGRIIGNIDGREHGEAHLKIWYGTKEENDRIVINWKAVKWYDEEGNELDPKIVAERPSIAFAADFEPDHEQKDLIVAFEKHEDDIKNYRIDLETLKLVKKED